MKNTLLLLISACLLFPFPTADAQTADECIAMIHQMETSLPGFIQTAKSSMESLVPDPAGYEKTLPARDKVVSDKDETNLKNYGGLSEAYLFQDQTVKAEQLRTWFMQSAKTMFAPGETFTAAVNGDFGIYYFDKKDFKRAEPLLLSSLGEFEANATPSIYNNMISDYLCLALIREKQGKKEEAVTYAKKLVALSVRQRQKAN